MLDIISQQINSVVQTLSIKQHISEKNIRDAVESIKLALLDADVNLRVVRRFVNHTIEEAVGDRVLKSVKPGEQFTKIVHDKMVELLGSSSTELALRSPKHLSSILLVGLQGTGKTTTAGKLAKHLSNKGSSVLLTSLDYTRPAAIEQLRQLASRHGLDFYEPEGTSAQTRAHNLLHYAKKEGYNVLLVDSAGRLQVDEQVMKELSDIAKIIDPVETIFVADAMTGQAAAETVRVFQDYTEISAVLLSKFDSDTRGGAALSIASVTGCPIKFIGTGEKITDLEVFYPERIASRILGMGDVVTLVEKAQEHVDQQEAEKLAKKIQKSQFTLEDYLKQFEIIGKMGSFEQVKDMLPGMGNIDPDELQMKIKKDKSLIHSMTKEERLNHRIIGLSRKRRIVRGSGASMFDINNFLKRFDKMKVMMKRMSKNNTIPIGR